MSKEAAGFGVEAEHQLENILERFDASVKGKFERCANTGWCMSEDKDSLSCDSEAVSLAYKAAGKPSRRQAFCSKSKFARKVARKLQSMKSKISKHKLCKAEMVNSVISNQSLQEQLRKGSNTPANSRPCSISMTMEQIENSRWKHSADYDGNGNSISCGGS